MLFRRVEPEDAMNNIETHNPDRARAVLFGALAKFVVWSQGHAPQELLDEAERALAQAGIRDGRAELANAA
jgi:hypothetical protein